MNPLKGDTILVVVSLLFLGALFVSKDTSAAKWVKGLITQHEAVTSHEPDPHCQIILRDGREFVWQRFPDGKCREIDIRPANQVKR